VSAIRKKIERDESANRAESLRIMQHNMRLIQEISALRSEVQKLKARKQDMRLAGGRGKSRAADGGMSKYADVAVTAAASKQASHAQDMLSQVEKAEDEERKLQEAVKLLE